MMALAKMCYSYDSDATNSHMNPRSRVVIIVALLFTYSVGYNSIGDAGAQALAKGLQHCTNLQELE